MQYKKIVAIVRTGVLETVEERLQASGVKGVTVTQVKGFGEYANFFRHDWKVTHARIEIILPAGEAIRVADTIIDGAHTGTPGDGLVIIIPVEKVIRIRTRSEAQEGDL